MKKRILEKYSNAQIDEKLYYYLEYSDLREEFLDIDMNQTTVHNTKQLPCSGRICNMLQAIINIP